MTHIAIIIPCFNAAPYIGLTLESVLAQTYREWSLVVIDDGSTDNSFERALEAAGTDARINCMRQENSGVAHARNRGRQCVSTGEYLLFLDADDILHPTMLHVLATYLDQHPVVGAVYSDCRLIDQNGAIVAHGNQFMPRFVPSGHFARSLPPDISRVPVVALYCLTGMLPSFSLIRRSVFEQAGGWDEEFGQPCEDTDLFLRIALRSEVHYLNCKLVDYRRHPGQSTSNRVNHFHQEQKLYAKWARIAYTTRDVRVAQTICNAQHCREVRLPIARRIAAARDFWQQRRYLRAIRAVAGAARLAAQNYMTTSPVGPSTVHVSHLHAVIDEGREPHQGSTRKTL